jgi:ornithine--oxo-acid transaminase
MSVDIKGLIAGREVERYQLHADHLNEQMVHVLKTIGFDKRYQRGVGQYLYDERGERYLDLLSGWGVAAACLRAASRQGIFLQFRNRSR